MTVPMTVGAETRLARVMTIIALRIALALARHILVGGEEVVDDDPAMLMPSSS